MSDNNLLFSDEELNSIEGNLFAQPWDARGPVVCLGMEFENDEARREYFRAELRRRLPELRHIEGFPIGEDEDIIALSDPPYYTACPNPWLNDFIASWESEKVALEAQGLRSADFQVAEPYAADVSEGKNNAIYMAHSYHTKVPHPAIMRYILHYTQPGDIVFDGFCGTGMTGVAAQLCGSPTDVEALGIKDARVGVRHAVCSDLSPIASLIAAGYNLRFDAAVFEKRAKEILRQVDKELGWMYETEVNGKRAKVNYEIWSDVYTCGSCGEEIVLWDVAVSEDTKTMHSEYACPHCGTSCSKKTLNKLWVTEYDPVLGTTVKQLKTVPVRVNYTLNGKRGEQPVGTFDIQLRQRINALKIDGVSGQLPDGEKTRDMNRSNGITHTHQFYTRRNFIYLSRVRELCQGDLILTLWFTSTLQKTSKLSKFMFNGTGILTGTLYVPSTQRIFSPGPMLQRKLEAFMKIFYPMRGNDAVSVASATALTQMADSSIDYIFVDPPFGANIMYSELNSIWEAWLKVKTDSTDEAIVNKVQNKSLFDYQALMNASLREFYRVLKPGKWMTVEFSNTSAAVWNSIQNALQGVGFVVANTAAIDKQQRSFNAVHSPTAVKQDLIISCFKPSESLTVKMGDRSRAKENVWDFVDEYLEHLPVHVARDKKTTSVIERSAKILFDRMISYYVVHGMPVPMDAHDFQAGLRNRYREIDDMFFTDTQAAEYQQKKRECPEFVPMGLIVSDEANGIEWLKNFLKDGPKRYNEIQPEWLPALQGKRKYDVIPDLKDMLEENFISELGEDGKEQWRLINVRDDKDLEATRRKALLREFAKYAEQARNVREKFSKGLRVEALRAGFINCYNTGDYKTIVELGDRIPQSLLTEDEVLLQYYDVATTKL